MGHPLTGSTCRDNVSGANCCDGDGAKEANQLDGIPARLCPTQETMPAPRNTVSTGQRSSEGEPSALVGSVS